MESIRSRSRTAKTRDRVRLLVACCAICLAALGAGTGYAAKIYDGVRVWLLGDKAAVTVSSLVVVHQPTASDLRNVVANATFPVVLPTGLPAGTRVAIMMFAPEDHPNSVTIGYRNQRANFKVGFTLFDAAVVDANDAMLPTGAARPQFRDGYRWQAGRETVLVLKRFISVRDMNRIKAAMMAASPADSLAATDAMLRRITVLGGAPDIADVAERYAPRNGQSTLLDREHIRLISSLVQLRKPMLDSRTIYLTNIPSVHGEPEYSKATLHWPKVIVVSAGGVRAIDAVLRSTGTRSDCACEILFNQPNNATYWVWKISSTPAPTVKKYSVDAKTFAVMPNP